MKKGLRQPKNEKCIKCGNFFTKTGLLCHLKKCGKSWSYKCPKCNKIKIFTNWSRYKDAVNHNRACTHACAQTGKKYSNISRLKMSQSAKDLTNRWWCYTKENKKRMSKLGFLNTGKKHLLEAKRKMNKPHIGFIPWNKGLTKETDPRLERSSETRRKNRESAIKDWQEKTGNKWPKYNSDSIPLIEKFGKKYGYNFQHAGNGGEFQIIGYFADAYDKKKNVWLEWDEESHYNRDGTLKDDDVRRQKEITECLDKKIPGKLCIFIRIRQKTGQVTIYHNSSVEILKEKLEFN